MGFLHCCLLLAIFLHSSPSFVASQYAKFRVRFDGARDGELGSLSLAIYDFTVDLHDKILESDKDGNIFFSPTSIYVALAMLYAGSEGETKKQLRSTLHLFHFNSDDEFYDAISSLHQRLDNTNKKYTLQMANRLFGQKELKFKDDYLKKTREYFRAELEALDFKVDSSASRSKINSWVEKMTSGKIKDLFPEDAITSDSVLALANAVYFRGSWLYEFDEEETKPQTFFVQRFFNDKIQVPMMHQVLPEGVLYTESKDEAFRLIELPYNDEDVSMLIAVQGNYKGFDELLREEFPQDSSYYQFVSELKNVSVKLSLPKFNLQKTMNLKETLETLGLKNLFENADLSGIADSSVPVQLSEAFHEAYVSVGELGTEAAAATGLGLTMVSNVVYEKKPIDFNVNRPFLFLVVEKTTGSVLFFGHIKDPLKTN